MITTHGGLARPQFRYVTRTRGITNMQIQYTPYLVCNTTTAETTLVKKKQVFY